MSKWNIYLSGEIHTDWRERIINAAQDSKMDIEFSAPITDQETSDLVGVQILGEESESFWRDRKGSGINAI